MLPEVFLVGRPEELMKVQLKLSRVELAENLILRILLRVLLLVDNHPVQKLHLSAPSRDSFESFMSISDLVEELEALISPSLRLPP